MEIDSARLRRDRILFYSGLVLLLLGLPGLILSSWAHDIARMPLVGEAYDAWGWINQTFALLGLFLAVFGGIFLAVSLRGGVVSSAEVKESEGEA
jgi:hypothetical protein